MNEQSGQAREAAIQGAVDGHGEPDDPRSSGMRLRRLTEADRAAMALLLADDGGYSERVSGSPATDADVEEILGDRPSGLPADRKHPVGLWQGDELVALADVLDGWPDDATAYIGLLQVRGDQHGRGVGRELHELLLDRFGRDRPWRLAVVEANAQALGFWRRLGYRETGERKPWVSGTGAAHTAVILQRPAS